MNRLKQVMAIALAAALLASAVGCQKSDASSAASEKSAASSATDYSKADPIELTLFSESSNFTGTQGGWFGQILKNKFNVTLKVISGQGDGTTLYNTRSASGNLGDIIVYGSNIQHFTDSIKANLLADMTDLLKTDGQYVTENYSSAVDRMKNDYGDKKAVYGLPNNVSKKGATESADGTELSYGNYMLWSAYKAAGSPTISTLEDLIPALKKMQAARPIADNGKKTYGFSLFKDWDGNIMSCAKQYACMYGWDEWGFNLVNNDATKIESIFDEDGQYYRSLKLYFNANQQGLLDPDCYAQTYDDFANTKLKNGQVLSNWWQWCCTTQYNTAEHTASTNSNTTTGVKGADGYVVIPIADETVITSGFSPTGANQEIAIGSKCADKNRAMALINWLYTPEGMEESTMGPEGLAWEMKDGKASLTEFGKKAVVDNTVEVSSEYGGGTWHDGGDWIGVNCVNSSDTDPNTSEPYYYVMWASYIADNSTSNELIKEWSSTIANGATGSHAFLDASKQVAVVPGTAVQVPTLTTEQTTEQTTIGNLVKKYSWKMVMATKDTDFNNYWSSMVKEAKAAGLDDVDKAYQDQYEVLKTARADAIAASK
jgi:putative aldouronate transport system substrate-binding protein